MRELDALLVTWKLSSSGSTGSGDFSARAWKTPEMKKYGVRPHFLGLESDALVPRNGCYSQIPVKIPFLVAMMCAALRWGAAKGATVVEKGGYSSVRGITRN